MSPKPKVLVVDDDADLVGLLLSVLAKMGFEADGAFDGEEGLAKARSIKPALAVVDIMMPKIHGYDLVQRLREDPSLAGIKILVISAKRYLADERSAMSVGADKYLKKPYGIPEFTAAVEELLPPSA